MLKHVVVAQDIAEAIREHDPAAEVVLGRGPEAIPEDAAPVVAFMGLSPADILTHPEVRRLIDGGTRIVLMGEAAEAAGDSPHWWVLTRPFTTAAVVAILLRAAAEPQPAAGGAPLP